MLDHENRRPRGFGFVTFANEETVDDVLNAGPLQACFMFCTCILVSAWRSLPAASVSSST